MKLYNITRPDGLFRKVEQCKGNVFYLDQTGQRQDMKRLAEQLLSVSGIVDIGPLKELDIELESISDCHDLLEFIVGSKVV